MISLRSITLISLIERGEIFGFLGSNGCGKTTTMKMLTGLLPVTEGEALLFGRSVGATNIDMRRRVGYMSQSFSLYGELTVRQNLELHARLFQIPDERAKTRIATLVEGFHLAEYLDERSDRLPLGIRQRLSLAVAVIHEPEMLILDEPTSGVDPIARDEFWALLVDLSRNQGVTIFISTHFMNEAARCDRVALMHAGRILATAAPAGLIEARGAATLEEAFIAYLEEATDQSPAGGRARRGAAGGRYSANRFIAIPSGHSRHIRSRAGTGRLVQPPAPHRLCPLRDAADPARPDPAGDLVLRHRPPDADLRLWHHLRCRASDLCRARPGSDAGEP